MAVTDQTTQRRVLHDAAVIATSAFIPETTWEPLEAARERHERALSEMREARIEEGLVKGRHRAQHAQEVKAAAGRVLDGEAAVDPVEAEERRRRESHAVSVRIQAARVAMHDAVIEALRLIEATPAWRQEIAAERAAAEAERDELRARADEANLRAHAAGHLAAWLEQAATKATPQPWSAPGPLPAPPQTIAQVFGAVAS